MNPGHGPAGRQALWRAVTAAVLLASFVAVFILLGTSSRDPDLSHVGVAILSGSEEGNYHAIVAKAAQEAQRRSGRIENVASAGSVDNINRLSAAQATCTVQFALVQEGIPWPESHPFQLIARLPVPEAFVVLGRDADRIRSVADLRALRLGVGPVGSGTEHVSRQVLSHLAGLDVKVSTHPLREQISMLERGELDIGAMVIDPDAALIVDAVRTHRLQIVDLSFADALAHRLQSAREGTIKAGYYDPVLALPPTDKRVIQIDTLLIGNGCARESVTQGVILSLARVFPELVRINREQPNFTGLAYASAAQSYYDDQGPDKLGAYMPWLIDIMPTARWLQLIFAFSLLFGAQAMWHRFRLWRLDANRVRLEAEVFDLFGPGVTAADIPAVAPRDAHRAPTTRQRIDALIVELERLGQRCRKQSLSMLVPMGQEMNYRYQEGLIADLLSALRRFRARLDDGGR